MKRYRVLAYDLDTRALLLSEEICKELNEDSKKAWLQDSERIKQGLLNQYGIYAGEEKVQNFIDLNVKPLSVLAFHNKFLAHCRNAFTIGAYYPALTGACALGERILNHLILLLRDDYKNTPEYRFVYKKDSFDNWEFAIDTLLTWKVLLPEVADKFRKLRILRNRAIHFNPEIDKNDRILALQAIHVLQDIVQTQFGAFGTQPWFLNIPGEAFIKRDFQDVPFIKKVYLPNCIFAGPKHRLNYDNGRWRVIDNNEYEDIEISDEEFCELRSAQ